MTRISNLPEFSEVYSDSHSLRAVVNRYDSGGSEDTGIVSSYLLVQDALSKGIEDDEPILNLDNHIGYALCGVTGMIDSSTSDPQLFAPCMSYTVESFPNSSIPSDDTELSHCYIPVYDYYSEDPDYKFFKIPLSEVATGLNSETLGSVIYDLYPLSSESLYDCYVPVYSGGDGMYKAELSEIAYPLLSSAIYQLSAITSPDTGHDYDLILIDTYESVYTISTGSLVSFLDLHEKVSRGSDYIYPLDSSTPIGIPYFGVSDSHTLLSYITLGDLKEWLGL